jgi:hypothetical protein
MPGPVKAKVVATRTKQMVLAFFDDQGVVYTNYDPRGWLSTRLTSSKP